jgi:hypothetical protein
MENIPRKRSDVTNINIRHNHMMNGIHSHGFPSMISQSTHNPLGASKVK